MPPSVMMDIAIIVTVAAFGALGWKRGLFRTLSELVVVVLSLVLASQISAAAAGFVVEQVLRPATERAVREQVSIAAAETTRTVQEKVGSVLESIPNSFVREHAQALLEETSLPDTLEAAGQEALLSACIQLTDKALNTVVYRLVHSLLYAVCFAVLAFALRFAAKILNRMLRLPGLRQLNQAGGLLLGAGKGLILAYVCIWLLSRTGVLAEEWIRGSILLGLAGSLPEPMQL